jgi:hypothetical protein
MSYSSEICNIMRQAYHLGVEIEAYRKDNGRDLEYRHRLVGLKQLEHREDELRRQAAGDFAALNGWRRSRSRFSVKTLLRAGVHDGYGQSAYNDAAIDPISISNLFDHALFFREAVRPYRAAAIVGQPYDTSADTARAAAVEIGLVLHVPTNVNVSWHYPGWTRFFCFTRPAVARVQFLPEQLERSEEAAG